MFFIDQMFSHDAGEFSGIEDYVSIIQTVMSNQKRWDDFASNVLIEKHAGH